MYGLLGQDKMWLWYDYLKIWNLSVQKNNTIEKIAFSCPNEVLSNAYY